MNVLGIVPVRGRHPLVGASIGVVPLVDLAVDLVGRSVTSVVVAWLDAEPPNRTLPAVYEDTTVLMLPAAADALTAAIGRADLVVVHDPMCPLVPASFVARMLRGAAVGEPLVAVRPVVDTIKATADGMVAGTVDRDALRVVSSPVVVASTDLLTLGDIASTLADPVALAVALRERFGARLVVAPPAATRVDDESGLQLLATVEGAGQQLGERD